MNEIYELAIESAEVELLLTEGFADKAKDIAKKAAIKIKEIIKKLLKKIVNVLDAGMRKYRKLKLATKDFIHDNDNRQIDIRKAYLVYGTLTKTVRDKIDRFYAQVRRGDSYDVNEFDVSDELAEMDESIDERVEVSIKKARDIVNNSFDMIESNLQYAKPLGSSLDKQMTDMLKGGSISDPNDLKLFDALNRIVGALGKMVYCLEIMWENFFHITAKIRSVQ